MTALQTDSSTDTLKYHGIVHDRRTKRWRAVREVASRFIEQAGGDAAITAAQRVRWSHFLRQPAKVGS